MQSDNQHIRRTAEGVIDIAHYARIAATERGQVRTRAFRSIARGLVKTGLAMKAIVGFWYLPPLGPSAKEWPYR
ncbi:MAG TPA: hypothetical protein PL193_17500 [Xanthobacteraceae bacterium]|nr:hypothetical protein [Xanthobacteraceae bacterium]